jgi:alkylation response protein AidB-like acyl-CoA dehydrogenase
MSAVTSGTETVEAFRERARRWLAENMAPADATTGTRSDERYAHERVLQRRLWDGGLAGICWPREYGGLGLDLAHQRAFDEESTGYDLPLSFNIPTFGILAATLIDCGTHEQKARHLPAILKGEELWVQFLSEPTGGSDLAGCITRADRDGDVFVLNGSKIWSSAAVASDYAMCLARTNWDVPKHRGLTMFIVKIHQPGIQIDPIEQVNGSLEFCQEFFDDVAIPAADVVGEVDDGWTVASRLLFHERTAVGGGSPYTSGRSASTSNAGPDRGLVRLAEATGRSADPRVRQVVARLHVEHLVNGHLVERVGEGVRTGALPAASGSMTKLFHAVYGVKRAEAALEVGGVDAVVWPDGSDGPGRQLGEGSLSRQAMCLGGGSNEIQRNIISERVLGMPREWAADREVAYRDVKRNTMPTGPGRP